MQSRRFVAAVLADLAAGVRRGLWPSCRRTVAAAAIVSPALGLLAVSVHAEDLKGMDARVAHKMAEQLCEQAKRLKHQQLHIDPDVTRAEGVHRNRAAAVIVVPQQGLKEDPGQNGGAVDKDPGAALGYLFAYQIVPVIRKKPMPAKRLRRVTVTGDGGEKTQVNCLLLAVRRFADDDWRLYVYGAEKRPLLDVPFNSSRGSQTAPLSVACKDVENFEGDLVVTVFGRYQAKFKVRYQPE